MPFSSAAASLQPISGDENNVGETTTLGELVNPGALEGLDPSVDLLGYYPTDLAVRAIDALHLTTGLEWWQSIALFTIMLRISTLPLGISAMKNGVRFTKMKPELDVIMEKLRSAKEASMDEQMRLRKEYKDLLARNDVKMWKNFVMPLIQLPVFMSCFFGLRKMVEIYPSMQEGGIMWFTDLTAADPYYALPIACSAMMLGTIELGGETGTPMQPGVKMAFRGLSVAMIPMTCHMPQAVFCYWITSNAFSVVQIAALKQPGVRNLVGLPVVSPAAESGPQSQSQQPAGEMNHAPTESNNSPQPVANVDANVLESKQRRRRRARRRGPRAQA